MLLPSTCPLCGEAGPAPCAGCIAALVPAAAVGPIDGLHTVRALIDYDRSGARLVGALKYRNARRLLPWLGVALAALVPPEARLITWAPTTRRHRLDRGFDQAELLARHVARRANLPVRGLLARGDRRSQTGLTRADRLVGPTFGSHRATSLDVAVIDDVVTTGATLAAAAATLRRSGSGRVYGVAVARTPDLSSTTCERQGAIADRGSKVSPRTPTGGNPYGRHDQ
jgi:predicted amidophosphoribosyltransferase